MAAAWAFLLALAAPCAADGFGAGLGVPPPAVRLDGAPPVTPGHGWMLEREVIRQRIGGKVEELPARSLVLHFPPRGGPIGSEPDPHGVLRYAPAFDEVAEHVAWWRERVYFLLAEDLRPGAGHLRRAATMRAVRLIMGGYEHSPGRPEELAPLLGDLEVIGFQATAIGPAALVRPRVRENHKVVGSGAFDLRLLERGVWRSVALDPAMTEELDAFGPNRTRRTVRLIQLREGLGVWVRQADGRSATLWVGAVGPSADFGRGPPDLVQWRRTEIPLAGATYPGESVPRLDRVLFVPGDSAANDALIGVHRAAGRLELIALRPSGPVPLVSVAETPTHATTLGLASPGSGASPGGTIVVAWSEVAPSSSPTSLNPQRRFQLREYSAISGRELYSGPAKNALLVTTTDFRLLAAMLVMIMIAVVLFVLRAGPAATPRLPEDAALADPIRRVGALLVDYVPGAVLSAIVLDLSPFALLQPSEVLTMRVPLTAVGAALLAGAAHCAIGEWLTGRSLGKRLFGIEVISAGAADPAARRRPALWQAVVRNLLKWMLPILGIVALFDGARRHGGDLIARTLVVMPIEDGPNAPTPPESE